MNIIPILLEQKIDPLMPHKYYSPNFLLGNTIPFLLLTILFLFPACSGYLNDEVQIAFDALPDKIDYNFHIKPILSDRCYNCHGPDPESRKAGLRLDLEEHAFGKSPSGNRAFVKGSIKKSEVMNRLLSDHPDIMMPPPESDLTISNTEIALIAKWIDQGAEWKEHWSFLPIEDPVVPKIEEDWVQENPIDNFIQAELLLHGFEPSDKTQRERLIKRVSMDLTGLPPKLEEIDRFINNTSENAYESLVDSLLNSISFAERMAQEWMDVSRYADSHGVSFDGYRTSWPFRDWVINAFNSNMTYDEFVTNQIAGDLIKEANEESLKATAFLRMNPLEASAGSIPEEFRIEYVNERASLVGTALMGLTLECAKCHDHKFDPITQKEFFQVSAFFNNTAEFGLAPTDSDRAPTLLLLNDREKVSIDSFIAAIDNHENDLAKIKNENTDYYQKPLPLTNVNGHIGYYPFDEIKFYKKEIKRKKKKKKLYKEIQLLDNNKKAEANLKVTLEEGKFGKGAYFGEEYDYVELREIGEFDHTDPFSVSTWIKTEKNEPGSTQTIIGNVGNVFEYHRGWDLILDSFNHVSVQFIHRLPDESIKVRSTEAIPADDWHHVAFTYDGSGKGKGISIFINGEKRPTIIEKDELRRSVIPIDIDKLVPDTIPLMVGRSNRLWMYDLGLFQGTIDEIKIFDRQLSFWEMSRLGQINSELDSSLLKADHWFLYDKSLSAKKKELRDLRVQLKEILDNAEELMIMEEMETPRKTYVLSKGLYDQPDEEVYPGGIAKVLPYNDNYPKNRLGLAKWLFDPNNPIVARVAINRYWQMIFGQGLVKTSEDFGSQGTRPSHPELLDWLASDFKNNDWDIKRAIKQMVLSHTYQQSAFSSDELREHDPQNILLARSPSYRWSAEILRDNVLMASGLLNSEVGGPSVKTYQPEGMWREILMASPKLSKYKQDTGDSLYRRSLYTFSRRFAPHPYMVNFDATSREICTIRRNITNTPLQALTLLNDPQIVEASRVLAEKMQKEFPDLPDQQIKTAFRKATSLSPSKEQIKTLKNHYLETLEHFNASPEKADSLLSVGDKLFDFNLPKIETAAMAVVINTIFNFDETYIKR